MAGEAYLTPATVAKMTAPQQPVNGTAVRGFGWDIDSPLSTNRGELLPVGGYGHTGFTGTSLWIDPATKTYIVLLTNAVHMQRQRKRGLASDQGGDGGGRGAGARSLGSGEDADRGHHRLQRNAERGTQAGGAERNREDGN